MPTGNLRNRGARLISLSHNPKLVSHRPAAPPLNPRSPIITPVLMSDLKIVHKNR
jgi:hypothetical protein